MYRDRRSNFRRSDFSSQLPRGGKKGRLRRGISLVITLAVIMLSIYVLLHFTKETPAGSQNRTTKTGNQTAGQKGGSGGVADSFNTTAHSTTDPASIWIVVNKQHPLSPSTYKPGDLVVPNVPLRSNISSDERLLRSEAAKALESLVQAAAKAGITLNLQSGYRSYTFQQNLYNGYVKQQGQAAADRTSARPGYSEHQTGLAADLGGTSKPGCNVEKCYAETPEGIWLAANAYTYGFLVRYTETKESVTGYDYEPWHIRYIGTDLARELYNQKVQTLEEFFGIPGGTTY